MNVEETINRLNLIINNQINNKNYDVALTAAKTLSAIYYDYNQIYLDKNLEDNLLTICDALLEKNEYKSDINCVLFYDGFGLDLRGWAASYVRALSKLGYHVIYACPQSSEGKIPHIISELDRNNSAVIYLDNHAGNINKAKEIDSIFKNFKPCAAFFYTTPDDVNAAIAFTNNKSTTRFQVDLTDHAYWIGINAFDYTIECREMGASLALFERGVEKSQILKLDCAPYIINDKLNEPYPFDIYKYKYIFSGGALYKTLGDKELIYYKTISYILDNFEDIKFLYAGSGDDSQIQKLCSKYPERVYYIAERSDFFEIIKNSLLYINTYPMFGGLMMRYAALAHKVPITLKHDHDADGILIDQDKLGIEYNDYHEYLLEIFKLLSDDAYRRQQEDKVQNAVISEEIFSNNISLMIKEHRTEYYFNNISKFDTSQFREEYKNRFQNTTLCKSFARKENLSLIKYFPKEIICGSILKVKEKLFK